MKTQQYLQQLSKDENNGSICSKTISRWQPTIDQLKILRNIFYNDGLRSPNAEQIHEISERLGKYGKIEPKNVFYWFHNLKSREKMKKKLADDPTLRRGAIGSCRWRKSKESVCDKYMDINREISCPYCRSSPAVGAVGQIEGSNDYGTVLGEKSRRDYSISRGVIHPYSSTSSGAIHPYPSSSTTLLDNREKFEVPKMKTLALFPIHEDKFVGFFTENSDMDKYYNGGYMPNEALEISLNACIGKLRGFP